MADRAGGSRRRAMVMGIARTFVAALIGTAWATAALAQVSAGGIRGFVRDESRAIVPGVTVEAQSPSRLGGAATTATDSQGLYRFEDLPVGIYTVTFTLTGFATVKREGIRVEAGRTIEMEQQLTVSTLQETVTVSGQSPVVDATHAGTSTNLNQETLGEHPDQPQPVLRRRADGARHLVGQRQHRRQLVQHVRFGHQPECLSVRRARHLVAELRRLVRLAELRHDVRAAAEIDRRLRRADRVPGRRDQPGAEVGEQPAPRIGELLRPVGLDARQQHAGRGVSTVRRSPPRLQLHARRPDQEGSDLGADHRPAHPVEPRRVAGRPAGSARQARASGGRSSRWTRSCRLPTTSASTTTTAATSGATARTRTRRRWRRAWRSARIRSSLPAGRGSSTRERCSRPGSAASTSARTTSRTAATTSRRAISTSRPASRASIGRRRRRATIRTR